MSVEPRCKRCGMRWVAITSQPYEDRDARWIGFGCECPTKFITIEGHEERGLNPRQLGDLVRTKLAQTEG